MRDTLFARFQLEQLLTEAASEAMETATRVVEPPGSAAQGARQFRLKPHPILRKSFLLTKERQQYLLQI